MIYDAIIIGGGVIGLSILHSSLISNYNTILIEQNLHLLNKASGRNSGILCTGVDIAPNNSLERALIRDSISRVREFCIENNVPMRECGSLVCLWPWDVDNDNDVTHSRVDEKKFDGMLDEEKNSRDKLQQVLHESHIAGDTDATFLSSTSISKLEPSLSTECRGAVHIPGETVVDPWLFPLAFATHSREIYNAKRKKSSEDDCEEDHDVIYTGRRVVMEESTFDEESGLWTIVTRRTSVDDDEDTTVTYTARCVINAAGIDSDLVQSQASASSGSNSLLPRSTFEARPRRGQYAIFAAPPDDIPTRPIQPVPSQFTKGIFVYSTLYDQIVVGPTAQDQSSRIDDTIDPVVANELTSHASRILGPKFNNKKQLIGQYVGIRPGTTQRDYQIQLHTKSNFITVGGIRSTGLTASLGIGRHVVQCLLPSIVPPPPVEEGDDEEELRQSILRRPTPLPDVKELVKQYHQRGDGTIVIDGHVYKVTHPLTKLGWDARSGIASC